MRYPCGLLGCGPEAFPQIQKLVPELKLSFVGAVGAIVGAVGAIVGAVGAIVGLKFSLKLIVSGNCAMYPS